MKRFAIDAGPLIALLYSLDEHHLWARKVFSEIDTPPFTCEPVIAEACYMVSRLKGRADSIMELVTRDVVRLSFNLSAEVEPVRALMSRYESVPMSLADACLVRMSELDENISIITLDSDFRIYRRHRRQAISTLMPK